MANLNRPMKSRPSSRPMKSMDSVAYISHETLIIHIWFLWFLWLCYVLLCYVPFFSYGFVVFWVNLFETCFWHFDLENQWTSAIDDHKVSLWLFRMAFPPRGSTGAALTQPARFDIQGGQQGLWGFPIWSITGSHFSLIPGWYPKTLELGYEWLFDVIRLFHVIPHKYGANRFWPIPTCCGIYTHLRNLPNGSKWVISEIARLVVEYIIESYIELSMLSGNGMYNQYHLVI